MFKINKEEIEINGKKIILETGKVARQADGAVTATCTSHCSWSKKN